MEFLNNAMEIEIYTRRKCKRFPKTERFTTSARLIGLAAEAAGHLSRGNDIYPATQHDKEFLKTCMDAIRAKCAEAGLTLSDRKTQIVKLTRGFTFLKVRTHVTQTGHIARRIYPRSVTRQRRKLFAQLFPEIVETKRYETYLEIERRRQKDLEQFWVARQASEKEETTT